MRPEQKDIYYLCAPSREAAAMSPYLEAFEQANVEVIFIYRYEDRDPCWLPIDLWFLSAGLTIDFVHPFTVVL